MLGNCGRESRESSGGGGCIFKRRIAALFYLNNFMSFPPSSLLAIISDQ
jgi:hypothetical protein